MTRPPPPLSEGLDPSLKDARVLVRGYPIPPQQNIKEIYLVVLPILVEFKLNARLPNIRQRAYLFEAHN